MRADAAATIIKALGGNPHDGMCPCPLHDDSTASLHVEAGHKVPVVLKCHAGCRQEDLIAYFRSRGLWPSSKRQAGEMETKRRREIERDEHERFRRAYGLLRTATSEGKSPSKYLKSRGIDVVPECAMLLSANGAARYGLPRFPAMVLPVVNNNHLLGAHVTPLSRDMTKRIKGKKRSFGPIKCGYVILAPAEPNRPLIVAEGIESALSAMKVSGLPGIATIGTSGMKSLMPPICSEIIICADNDQPGLIAAEELARQLAPRRVVRIAVPERKDWNEELREATDFKKLRRTILKAERFEEEGAGVRALTMEEVIAMAVPPREHLLGPWLDTGSLAMTHAPRGDGKTLLMMSVAYAVASGLPLLDWECERPVRVLYVDGELPTTVLQERLKSLGPITPNLMVLSRDIMLRENEMTLPDLGEPAGRKFLDKIIERERINFVILDSLSTLIRSGVENDAESWAPIQDWLLNHRFANRTIMLVHHEGRSGHARGTSKREDALDTIVKLKGREDLQHNDKETVFELTFTKAREFYGTDKAPLILRLSTATGIAVWTHETVRDHTRDRVNELRKAGLKQKQIAKELDLTEARISQIVKEMKAA